MKKLFALLCIGASLFVGCSDDDDDGKNDGSREVISINMVLDVPSACNGAIVDLAENSWVDGFIDFPYSENIVSCNPTVLKTGIQEMNLMVKRHTDTNASYCFIDITYGENYTSEVFLNYSYKSELEVEKDGYGEAHNYIDVTTSFNDRDPIYITDLVVEAPTSNKINIYRTSVYDKLQKVDLSKCPCLKTLKCTRHPVLQSLDLSNNLELTDVDCSSNESLTEIWLKQGQDIVNLTKDSHTVIKYK